MEIRLDNRDVQVETGGQDYNPATPTIVFVHGAGMDHTVWTLQSRYFAHHGYSVLAVDLPGHGGTQGPPLSSIEEMADWLQHLIMQLSTEPVGIIGHSMGALVALEVVAQHPEMAIFLGLLGVSIPMPVNPELLAKTKNDIPEAVKLIVTWAYGKRSHVGGTSTPGLWMLGGGRQLLLQNNDGLLHADFLACDHYVNGISSAKKVRCPTILIAGSDDRMTPSTAVKLVGKNIASSEIEVIPHAGHMMMIEKPDQTLQILWEYSALHMKDA